MQKVEMCLFFTVVKMLQLNIGGFEKGLYSQGIDLHSVFVNNTRLIPRVSYKVQEVDLQPSQAVNFTSVFDEQL